LETVSRADRLEGRVPLFFSPGTWAGGPASQWLAFFLACSDLPFPCAHLFRRLTEPPIAYDFPLRQCNGRFWGSPCEHATIRLSTLPLNSAALVPLPLFSTIVKSLHVPKGQAWPKKREACAAGSAEKFQIQASVEKVVDSACGLKVTHPHRPKRTSALQQHGKVGTRRGRGDGHTQTSVFRIQPLACCGRPLNSSSIAQTCTSRRRLALSTWTVLSAGRLSGVRSGVCHGNARGGLSFCFADG